MLLVPANTSPSVVHAKMILILHKITPSTKQTPWPGQTETINNLWQWFSIFFTPQTQKSSPNYMGHPKCPTTQLVCNSHTQHLNRLMWATMLKCLRGLAPAYLPDYCKLTTDNTGRSHLRSANTCLLSVPRTRTTYGDRSFAISGPVTWNSLLAALRSSAVSYTHLTLPTSTLCRSRWSPYH